jgi:hemerythrin-like domain-containing protein
MEFRFTDPATDFADGILVLRTYHRDFLIRGQRLLDLVEAIDEYGMTETYANTCVEFHCYYTRANHLHHQDEESALFPLLARRSYLIDGMLERLALDHEEIDESWSELAALLSAPEALRGSNKLLRSAREFEKLQREHLTREDEDFLPVIDTMLTQEARLNAGRKMATLRFPARAASLPATSMA